MTGRATLLGALLAGCAAVAPVRAQQQPSDWPCVQRLVPQLAAAQMWSGPAPVAADWQSDTAVAPLALRLARVKTPLPEAEAQIAAFTLQQPAGEREGRLGLLFEATLEIVNGERHRLIEGIKRFARKQQELAAEITVQSEKLRGIEPGMDSVPPPELAEIKEARDWNIRVFEDRQRSMRYLCDQPVMLEQRAFAMARAMQAELRP